MVSLVHQIICIDMFEICSRNVLICFLSMSHVKCFITSRRERSSLSVGVSKAGVQQGNRHIFVVWSRPTFLVLDLDGKLLQVFVVLHVLVNGFANELRALLAVLLLPCSVILLVRGLCLLL